MNKRIRGKKYYPKDAPVTQEELKALLRYDPKTGLFYRLKTINGNARVGDVAGSSHKDGYTKITVNYRSYMAHRLAWLYVYGAFPVDQIDHLNGNRTDNRIDNLRESTQKQNVENTCLRSDNTSGCRGVSYNRRERKYIAKVENRGKTVYWARFDDLASAANAVQEARQRVFTHDVGRAALQARIQS